MQSTSEVDCRVCCHVSTAAHTPLAILMNTICLMCPSHQLHKQCCNSGRVDVDPGPCYCLVLQKARRTRKCLQLCSRCCSAPCGYASGAGCARCDHLHATGHCYQSVRRCSASVGILHVYICELGTAAWLPATCNTSTCLTHPMQSTRTVRLDMIVTGYVCGRPLHIPTNGRVKKTPVAYRSTRCSLLP